MNLLRHCCFVLVLLSSPLFAALPAEVEGQPMPSLAPMLERTTAAVVNVSSKTRVQVRNPQTFVGGGPNFDIDFALLGPDLDVLYKYAEQLRKKAPELGLQDADITLKLDKPELRVEIDRERAANLGVDTEDIATALRMVYSRLG